MPIAHRRRDLVAECVGRVVADLFELREGGEDDRPPLHPFVLVGLFEQLVDDLLVEHGLLAGEPGPGDLFDLVGQFGYRADDRPWSAATRTGGSMPSTRQRPLRPRPRRRHARSAWSSAVAELLAEPSMPGLTQSRIAHSSDKRFSTGVPVSAMRWPACSLRTARPIVAGFLTNCASSRTTVAQATSARTSRSRLSKP